MSTCLAALVFLGMASITITAAMTTLVLPGDALPLPTPPASTTLHLHLGPGTAQSAPRTHDDDDDDARTLYVARKMGALQTSNKRRKVRDGKSEVQTRVWVNVEAKRVSLTAPFSYRVANGNPVCAGCRGERCGDRHGSSGRIIQGGYWDGADCAAESVCI